MDDILQLIERWQQTTSTGDDDIIPKNQSEIYKVDGLTMVTTKLDALTKRIKMFDMIVVNTTHRCEICGKKHTNMECNMINRTLTDSYIK